MRYDYINLVAHVPMEYTSFKVDGKPEVRFADIAWYKQTGTINKALPFVEFKVENGALIQPVEQTGESDDGELTFEFFVDSAGRLNPRLKKEKVTVEIKAYNVILLIILFVLIVVAIIKYVL